jgi:hypothetical protein
VRELGERRLFGIWTNGATAGPEIARPALQLEEGRPRGQPTNLVPEFEALVAGRPDGDDRSVDDLVVVDLERRYPKTSSALTYSQGRSGNGEVRILND